MVWGGRDRRDSIDLFAPWLEEQGFAVEISNDLDSYLDRDKMSSTDLVVQQFTMGGEDEDSRRVRGLIRAVRNGTGLAGWHGGLVDAFRHVTEYQYMTGGQWAAHALGE